MCLSELRQPHVWLRADGIRVLEGRSRPDDDHVSVLDKLRRSQSTVNDRQMMAYDCSPGASPELRSRASKLSSTAVTATRCAMVACAQNVPRILRPRVPSFRRGSDHRQGAEWSRHVHHPRSGKEMFHCMAYHWSERVHTSDKVVGAVLSDRSSQVD